MVFVSVRPFFSTILQQGTADLGHNILPHSALSSVSCCVCLSVSLSLILTHFFPPVSHTLSHSSITHTLCLSLSFITILLFILELQLSFILLAQQWAHIQVSHSDSADMYICTDLICVLSWIVVRAAGETEGPRKRSPYGEKSQSPHVNWCTLFFHPCLLVLLRNRGDCTVTYICSWEKFPSVSLWHSQHIHILLQKLLNTAQVLCQPAVMWPDWNSTIVLRNRAYSALLALAYQTQTCTFIFPLFILSRLNRNLDWNVS